MSDVTALEAEVKEFKIQLETVQSSLQVDPDNTELQSLKAELEELISLTETSIAELRPAKPSAPPKTSTSSSSASHHNHSASHHHHPPQSDSRTPTVEPRSEEQAPVSFSVNDHVLARWVSGDGAFYPARITSITGSSSNPVYLVSFKSYATVESLTARDIRPVTGPDSRKRKADGSASSATSSQSSTPQPSHAGVISAAADINPALATQARNEPSKVSDGPARPAKVPRKVKATRELEEGKNKWKDFASKGKIGRKQSMFRTGEGVNARVGFTGSGQQMRKDPTRTRHVYQQGEEEGY
ncbi:hypothetical protein P168DRAFT_255084 [Aspergillus campestris IBT 28561]|uniref:Tudor domain-containing protein n=1 Tax=Aspergillus campestris (strain IBT 28561) TaxID=1392248 RepID=A0A2I1CZG3_ASPC2|nr:uncharacterized protein P168DRAFT_255084 [Aspergillus campestris IBT 28561]PKY02996.1 hypothetical protein P168DRAFT_255084 [Aspergillus campestris IBT 28561]